MKRRRVFSSSQGKSEDINISPLIDMVFILLIFFIVTTVFVEETGVEVTRPQAASANDLEKESILRDLEFVRVVLHAHVELCSAIHAKLVVKRQIVRVWIEAGLLVGIDHDLLAEVPCYLASRKYHG